VRWLLLAVGMIWWIAVELYRGHPSCPSKLSFWLTFLGPAGGILLLTASLLI